MIEQSTNSEYARGFLARQIMKSHGHIAKIRSARNYIFAIGYFKAVSDVFNIIGIEYSITLDQIKRMFEPFPEESIHICEKFCEACDYGGTQW